MSIENIFNSPATRKKLKGLENTFNRLISGINQLDIGTPADDFIGILRGEYIKRRTEVMNENVDVNANIDYTPKTRTKKTATAEKAPEVMPPAPGKTLTAAQKLKQKSIAD